MNAATNRRRRLVPVVLLAAGFVVAGCGSQQASPLSVAKTEQAFGAAGIHLRPAEGVHYFSSISGGKGVGHAPVAWLIWGSGDSNFPSFVLVYRGVADAVRQTRLPTNPSMSIKVTRVQNVVIYAARGSQDPTLRAAIRHLYGSGGPATYARLRPAHAPSSLEVWRDPRRRLTFRWLGDHPGEVDRYDPSTFALAEFSGGQALGSTTYTSNRAAWSHIGDLYGVTESQVASALASGRRSAEPPAYRVKAPQHRNSDVYEGFTDYGTNLEKMAKETGFVLPRLASLDGYPLVDAAVGPQGLVGLSYGSDSAGDSMIDVDFAKVRPGDHEAAGTVDKSMFDSPRWRHHNGPVPYAEIGGGQILFPYRSEWAGVSARQGNPGARGWAKIIRAILAAPTH